MLPRTRIRTRRPPPARTPIKTRIPQIKPISLLRSTQRRSQHKNRRHLLLTRPRTAIITTTTRRLPTKHRNPTKRPTLPTLLRNFPNTTSLRRPIRITYGIPATGVMLQPATTGFQDPGSSHPMLGHFGPLAIGAFTAANIAGIAAIGARMWVSTAASIMDTAMTVAATAADIGTTEHSGTTQPSRE